MAHYNPSNQLHGAPGDTSRCHGCRHAGDMGNVYSDEKGEVSVEMTDNQVVLAGLRSVYGRTVVVSGDSIPSGLTL